MCVERQSNIDAARGVAVLMVVLTHSLMYQGIYDAAILQLGVQLFFVVSAFTLCYTINRSNFNIILFYQKRLKRIAPLYWFGILLYITYNLVLSFIGKGQIENYTAENIAMNVLLLHGLSESANNSIVPGGWSIATEVIFYLIFPFVYKSCDKAGTLGSILFCVAMSILNINVDLGSFYYYSIFVQLPCFIVGICLYKNIDSLTALNKEMSGNVSFIFMLVGVYFWHLKLYSVSIFAMSVCFVFFILWMNGKKNNALEDIGRKSYSVYIIHFIFAGGFSAILTPILGVFVTTIIVVLLSWFFAGFTYKYIEGLSINIPVRFPSSR